MNEVEDSESLVRCLLYSNEFDSQGVCAITSEGVPNTTYPGAMRDTVEAYGEVVDNLNHHASPGAQYPSARALLGLVTSSPSTPATLFCPVPRFFFWGCADIETRDFRDWSKH